MYKQSSIHSSAGTSHGSSRSYLVGFLLSVLLIPFALVMFPSLPRTITAWLVVALGVIQIVVHLKFFLHLDTAEEQRWNLIALIFSAVIILLLVGLSLWIMGSIHHNMLAH
ncbi:Cytochrome o ubiquinol oxidase, subunit IV [Pseudomonas syringae pv. maculicola]|uniref:Cytochrome bo(3) ubiquinol oxidase subunit 4 n=1 Tax=Pseudomonas syringae pv. maculicola TaxID=59511 RepID=A0A0N0X3E5_PSEYM|nr:cytochrome o ubiquinol oxidase subunit IV [Pseudomonas syringae group genomosp. 3]KPC18508.1 Cytochrome o ubiquinol oxidase [Pseudomonas syringae pv. maculicola]MBM0210060.1 cytochrome o ubiquinol oxidase subunit IV [Pseudomonas syringae pv. maculicola]RMM77144.1 Cytochrome o ubiquinol oxidase, subunit IV [Pseudomonas syringae pv. maculicola]RMV28886.1 Cytochrome o ubiquinol oxidase, subunit IV [Pseudomonas syringae pv. maculicola]